MLSKEFVVNWMLALIVVLIGTYIINFVVQLNVADYHYYGIPLKYVEGGGMCVNDPCGHSFYPLNLLVDLLFCAIIAFGITYLLERKPRARK